MNFIAYCLLLALGICMISAQSNQDDNLNFANLLDVELSDEEINLFKPIWEILQKEYDEALNKNQSQTEQGQIMMVLLEKELENQLSADDDVSVPFVEYEINLPTVDEILKDQNPNDEIYEDMKAEIEEALNYAEESISDLIVRANEAETNLTNRKGGKITLVKIIYKLLRKVFRVITTVTRAAYCTYSHIPEVIRAVKSVEYRTRECGQFALNLTKELRHNVQESIDAISNSIGRMGLIYSNAMGRKTVFGKIFYFVINVGRMQDQISQTCNETKAAIKKVAVGAPQIITSTKNCQINAIHETVFDVKSVLLTIKACIPHTI